MMGPVQARALRAIAIGAAAMAVLAPSAGATIVDGGKFSGSETGVPFEVRDGAGNLVLRDRGVIRHDELFDTLGDGAPGGVVIDDQIVGVGGPHPALDQTDAEFCAMVTALVG
jgi:hypothetical protein